MFEPCLQLLVEFRINGGRCQIHEVIIAVVLRPANEPEFLLPAPALMRAWAPARCVRATTAKPNTVLATAVPRRCRGARSTRLLPSSSPRCEGALQSGGRGRLQIETSKRDLSMRSHNWQLCVLMPPMVRSSRRRPTPKIFARQCSEMSTPKNW